MEAEQWVEDKSRITFQHPTSVDGGRSLGRGRGFMPVRKAVSNNKGPGNFSTTDDDWKDSDVPNFPVNDQRSSNFKGRGSGRGGQNCQISYSHDEGSGYQGQNKNEQGRGFKTRENGSSDDRPKPRERYIPPEPSNEEATIFSSGISSGINFDKYDNIHVKVSGENIPRPIDTFETAGLHTFVLSNVKKSGYTKPTPVQKNALPVIMGGRDLMACAQTGSGKTAAFLLPIINTLLTDPKDLVVTGEHCEPHAVVISPTRELTLQIFNEARKFAHGSFVKIVVAYGGTVANHQAQYIMRGCHILVATPGRLLDFVNRGRITFSSLRFFILDEADRMLDMGFLPDVEQIMGHPTMVPNEERQTLMFSATFPEDVQHLAGKFLHNYLFLAVGIVGGACSDVQQRFHLVTKVEKRQKLKDLISQGGGEKTLVFVETKRTADFIASYLSESNFPTTSIHGDRLQRERELALCDFKTGRMEVLVATAVAARGLDIKDVSHVVNFDLPKTVDEYVHRIGRTGRVGNRGKATSFYDPEFDAPLAKQLLKILQQDDNSGLLWCDTTGQLAHGVLKIVVLSSSGSSSLRRGAFTASGTTNPVTQCHIPEYLNGQPVFPTFKVKHLTVEDGNDRLSWNVYYKSALHNIPEEQRPHKVAEA